MINKILSLINQSLYDKFGKVSSARISSFILLTMIVITSLVYLGIDIANAINSTSIYKVPAEHIIIFGMLLTHHLMLLGIKKSAEDKK